MLLKKSLRFCPITIVVAIFLIQIIPEGCSRSIEESNAYGSAYPSTKGPKSSTALDDTADDCGSFDEEDDNSGDPGEKTGGSITGGLSNSDTDNADEDDRGSFDEEDDNSGDPGGKTGGSITGGLSNRDTDEEEESSGKTSENGSGGDSQAGGTGIWNFLSEITGGSETGHDTDANNSFSGTQGLIGSVIGGLFGKETAGGSADDDKSSTISRSGNITSFIENAIKSYGGLTDEDSRNIFKFLKNFQSGEANGEIDVHSAFDLIGVLRKYDLLTFLKVFSQYLLGWQGTIDSTSYGILNLITKPQKQLYKLIRYVIFHNQRLIESVVRSILGDNFLIDSIFGFGNKTVKCIVSSAEDLPAVIGDDLIRCVTGRVKEIIQLVTDAVLEIRRTLELMRHMVNSVTGCDGLFCLGAATGSTVTKGIGLMIDVIGTIAHSVIFAGTIFVQLPGCFVGSVTISPGIEIAKMVGRMGRCMIS